MVPVVRGRLFNFSYAFHVAMNLYVYNTKQNTNVLSYPAAALLFYIAPPTPHSCGFHHPLYATCQGNTCPLRPADIKPPAPTQRVTSRPTAAGKTKCRIVMNILIMLARNTQRQDSTNICHFLWIQRFRPHVILIRTQRIFFSLLWKTNLCSSFGRNESNFLEVFVGIW